MDPRVVDGLLAALCASGATAFLVWLAPVMPWWGWCLFWLVCFAIAQSGFTKHRARDRQAYGP